MPPALDAQQYTDEISFYRLSFRLAEALYPFALSFLAGIFILGSKILFRRIKQYEARRSVTPSRDIRRSSSRDY